MKIELAIIQESDLELLRIWRMQPIVTRYMCTDPVITIEDQLRWYECIKGRNDEFYWIIKCNNIRIGYFSITHIDYNKKSCEVGHYIGDSNYYKKGISKIIEANIYDFIFDKLSLEKVEFVIFKDNIAAYCLHTSLGAIEEGKVCKSIVKNNITYAMTRLYMSRKIWNGEKKNRLYPSVEIEL